MRARLIILIVLGAGLALFLAFRRSPVTVADTMPKDTTDDNALMLWKYDLDCPRTDVKPDVELSYYLDESKEGNRLNFELSERHNFYVESFLLEFWYMPEPDTTCEEAPYCVRVPLDNYIKAGEVYEGCIELNGAEVGLFGKDMGTIDNWGGHLLENPRQRWCTENPKLLRREKIKECVTRD